MDTISVSKCFSQFLSNLRRSSDEISRIKERYHSIAKQINRDYWNSRSTVKHCLYVGSSGRGTAIYNSDVDIVVVIPWHIYDEYNQYSGNVQLALLKEVQESLSYMYSAFTIGPDGQVVDIIYYDGIKFEVVPAFRLEDGSGFCYPDANGKGSWKTMNPRAEIKAFNERNRKSNGNLKRLAQMMRAWNLHNNVGLSGILIDILVYEFYGQSGYSEDTLGCFDRISRDFFEYLISVSERKVWEKPGSFEQVNNTVSFKKKAQKAYRESTEAFAYKRRNMPHSWHGKWRLIYGDNFPEFVQSD